MNQEIEIRFDEILYPQQAVQRVLSKYTNEFYIQMRKEDNSIIVSIENKEKQWKDKHFEKMLKNEILEETVRMQIEEETKDIRTQLFQAAIKP